MVNIFGLFDIPDLFFTILLYIGVGVLPVIFLFILGYRNRIPAILSFLRLDFFFASITDEVQAIHERTILIKDLVKIGKASYFPSIGGHYWVRPSRTINKVQYNTIYHSGGKPKLFYNYGNPEPNIVFNPVESAIPLMTESDLREFLTLTSKENKDAIESKVVTDILRFTFDTKDKLMIILIAVGIGIGVINGYFVYNINSQFSSLINQLNQLLAHLTTPSK